MPGVASGAPGSGCGMPGSDCGTPENVGCCAPSGALATAAAASAKIAARFTAALPLLSVDARAPQ
jgi:hypothetical protein